MKKARNINFIGLSLLLLYLFSNTPVSLFHHHDNHIVAYNQATLCEKAIYYASKGDSCHHKAHISKALEKCSLCDNHTISTHTGFDFFIFIFLKAQNTSKYNSINDSIHLFTFINTTNRGPPTI